MNGIRYFSMFSGVGGFELGLERANDNKSKTERYDSEEYSTSDTSEPLQRTSFSCVGYSEIDKYSIQTYQKNFPNHINFGDCTTINPNELPDFDMLCGGFPCQSFSIAGKRRGFKDTRGTMFFEIARILEVKRPKLVLLENVKGLLNHDKGKTFSVIIQALEELGYRTQWMVLNSKFFGVPQNRERVFIIGSLRGEPRSEILPFGYNGRETNDLQGQQTNTLTARYEKSQATGSYIKCFQRTKAQHSRIYEEEGISPTLAGASKLSGDCTPKIRAVLTPNRPEKRQNRRRFKEDGEPAFTITGQDIHGVAINRGELKMKEQSTCIGANYHKGLDNHQARTGVMEGMKIRRLTPTECERLQGFPDGWTEGVSDTQRYKQMGNAVTVNVIEAIASKL